MARPRVLLNCATSLDGRLAAADGSPMLLSGEEDLRRVHRMRAEADAILVGVGTVLADDPSLRVKAEAAGLETADGKDPVRVVLDPRARAPRSARVFRADAPTLWMVGEDAGDLGGLPGTCRRVRLPLGPDGRFRLADVLDALAASGIQTVMVEGGARVLASFLESGLWDRFTLYQAPVLVGGGPALSGGSSLWRPSSASSEPLGDGVLWTFHPASD